MIIIKQNKMQQKGSTVSKQHMVYNKAFGQHILTNPQILQMIVDKSAVRPTDVVLEIGPGTGNLTELLLQRAKKVICVEIDPRMIVELTKRFKYSQYAPKFQLIQGDFLTAELPFFDLCVANVPYQISSPLVFKLLAHRPLWRCSVLMFQKEFAMRLVAKPGNELYCRLSANVQLLSRVDHLMKVGRNNFRPPPKVESSVVRLEPRHPLPTINYTEWNGLLRTVFNRKNKQLSAIFKTKSVLKLMEENFNLTQTNNDELSTLKSLIVDNMEEEQNKPEKKQKGQKKDKESDDESEGEGKGDMQDEQQQEQGKQETKNPWKLKIIKLLQDAKMFEMRPIKMTQDDFLKLLYVFNQEGIHFK